jgi:hypothetical protein
VSLVNSTVGQQEPTLEQADDCASLRSGETLAEFLHSMESIMDLNQLYSSVAADDPLPPGPSFPFDILHTAACDDDDAWSDDGSTSSLLCGDVCLSDVLLPRHADQHLRLFPGPSDAAAAAIDLVQQMSTDAMLRALPVDPLYALQHECARTKKSAIHLYSLHERLAHQISSLKDQRLGRVAYRAHFDGGASASTTNRMELLWFCRRLTRMAIRLKVADGEIFTPSHEGYLSVPDGSGSYQFVHCFYTAGIKATIISPFRACTALNCRGVSSYVDGDQQAGVVTIHSPDRTARDITFPCHVFHGLLYSDVLRVPTAEEHVSPLPKSTLTLVRLALMSPLMLMVTAPLPLVARAVLRLLLRHLCPMPIIAPKSWRRNSCTTLAWAVRRT